MSIGPRAEPMNLLQRYVVRQIVSTFLIAVAVLCGVFVLGSIMVKVLDLLVNAEVPMVFVARFIAYIVPFSLMYTIPWAMLTTVLLVFGKLSAENELTAARASGISVQRLCMPTLMLALLLSGFCFWINISIAPKAQQQMKETLKDVATSDPLALFGSDRIIDQFPGRKIYVGQKDGSKLRNIQVYELDAANKPIRVISAREGRLEVDLAGEQVLLRLTKATYEERDQTDLNNIKKIRQGITMEEGVLPISLAQLYARNQKQGLSSKTLAQLYTDLKTGADVDRQSATRTELNKRYSLSLGCFALALVGIPLGITAHRRETSIGFGLSLAVAVAYFLFIMVADNFRNNPAAHPEWLIWLPNIIFLALGAWLFERIRRR